MLIFGILNVTPDSFSDSGAYHGVDAAVSHAHNLIDHGAEVIDVGGESTRPGATPIAPLEEQRRVMPVIEELIAKNICVSIDTLHHETAALAIRAGVQYVNDVSGGTADPAMIPLLVDADVDYVAMHWGGGADSVPTTRTIAGSVTADLREAVSRLQMSGMNPERIILDPGLGFGKSSTQNWELIGALRSLSELGHRLLIGHSRKRFIAELLADSSPMRARDRATAAVSVLCAEAGCWAVRVHDPLSTRRALQATGRRLVPRQDG